MNEIVISVYAKQVLRDLYSSSAVICGPFREISCSKATAVMVTPGLTMVETTRISLVESLIDPGFQLVVPRSLLDVTVMDTIADVLFTPPLGV